MTTERIQLHSSLGRHLLLACSYMPWLAILGCFTSMVLLSARHGFSFAHLVTLVEVAPMIIFARWAHRNATPVYATSQGLELSARKRTVPWSAVTEAHEIPFVGNMLSVHRVTFSDGTPPLTFYSGEGFERTLQYFKPAKAAA